MYNMKTRYYYIIYILLIVSIFFLPNLCVKQGAVSTNLEKIDSSNDIDKNIEGIKKEKKKIKLLMTDINEVVELDLDEYIKSVVCAEMPATYEMEALRAQAIVARTYTMNKIESGTSPQHNGADVCDQSTHCQAYLSLNDRLNKWNSNGQDGLMLWDRIEEAVISTSDKIIVYENKPIQAFFHANSGGKTEDVELVWNGNGINYLKSVETIGEDNYSQYSSNPIFSLEEFQNIMKSKYSNFKIDFEDENCIRIIERSESNRVQKIVIGNIELSGIDVRKLFALKSTNFEVQYNDKTVDFNVLGYGHGVGMSQTGANELAKNGYDYEKIIKHYYIDVEIIEME